MNLWAGFVRWWQGSTPPRDDERNQFDEEEDEELLRQLEEEARLTRGRLGNRSALVVRPREPFKRWAARVSGEKFDENSYSDDHTAYLIPMQESVDVDEQSLRSVYGRIFEAELGMINTDRKKWPARRTLAMFREWFEIETFGMVIDLVDEPIERDD
jgi:hypothetical protein